MKIFAENFGVNQKQTIFASRFQKGTTRKALPGAKSQPFGRYPARTACWYQQKQISGRLAQLVQSICLTSRGSAVQIRQRPPFFIKHLSIYFGRCFFSLNFFPRQGKSPNSHIEIFQLLNGVSIKLVPLNA